MIRSPHLHNEKPKRPPKQKPYDPKDYDGSDSGEPIEVTE
jgi:hypothetical protein